MIPGKNIRLSNYPLLRIYMVSTLAFILMSFVLAFIHNYTTVFIAADFGIKSTILHDTITFLTPFSSPLWTRDAVISVSIAGPAACFFTGVILIFLNTSFRNTFFPFIGIWGYIHAFNYSLGVITSDMITSTGLALAAGEYHFGIPVQIIISLLSLFFLYRIGYASTPIFNRAIAYTLPENGEKKLGTYFSPIILSWFTGSLISLWIRSRLFDPAELLSAFFLLVILLPCYLAGKNIPVIKHKTLNTSKVSFLMISMLLLIIVVSVCIRLNILRMLFES